MGDKIFLECNSLKNIERGDYVSFDLSCGTLFKVLDVSRRYVLVESVEFCGECWERKEYICCVFKFKHLNGGVRYYLEKENLI